MEISNIIFVFGSNLAGIHGAGSAKHALTHFGAVYGIGKGFQGRSYAIPTKDHHFNVLPLETIYEQVLDFFEFAEAHPELEFHVVEIGCGLAGYRPEQIAPMFIGYTENMKLPESFIKIINETT